VNQAGNINGRVAQLVAHLFSNITTVKHLVYRRSRVQFPARPIFLPFVCFGQDIPATFQSVVKVLSIHPPTERRIDLVGGSRPSRHGLGHHHMMTFATGDTELKASEKSAVMCMDEWMISWDTRGRETHVTRHSSQPSVRIS
jgi:hypothetical protein